jgi:flagellar operon protein (TIGR03826 family)
MSLNVANCQKCGKIFVKGIHDICPNCYREIEQQYEKCLKYLRENRKCTLLELSEATGVSVNQITKFIREGRISIVSNPNMSYSCEMCGASIREGAMCESCRQKLLKDVNHLSEDAQRKQEQSNSESKISYNIKDRLQDRR